GDGSLFYPSESTPLFPPKAEETETVEDAEGEDEVDTDEEDEELDQEEELEDDVLESLPFPSAELHEWELRHARRRGSESSYRHQRKDQFYPIFIDEKARRVVKAGAPIPLDAKPNFSKVNGLTPIWPIDKEKNERCWRFVTASMQKRIDEGK